MGFNEQERREYWTAQMDAANAFMLQMIEYPVEECGEPLASMTDAVKAAGVEVEFSTSKIAADMDRVYYLRAGLIDDFIAIARDMNSRGWVMKVEDGYRSTTMQMHLARKPNVFDAILRSTIWENGGEVPSTELLFRRVSSLCATRPKTGTHMSGSAIDISVFDRDTRQEIDRGRPYLEMSELTPMLSPYVSPEAQQNRRDITDIMERHGFMHYPYEFWHYNKGDCYAEALNKTGKPGRYGAVHVEFPAGLVTPVPNPQEPLHSAQDVQREIEASLRRMNL